MNHSDPPDTESMTVTAHAQDTLQHFQRTCAALAHACGRPWTHT